MVALSDFTNGRWVEQEDPRLAWQARSRSWAGCIQDGIDGTEAEAIQALLYIAVTSRSVVSSLISLGWVRDGITDDEAEAIDWINNMAGAEVMSAVVALDWVRDGIDDLEVRTIEELSYIAYEDSGLGLSAVSLVWVQDGIDDLEARAIQELSQLAYEDAEAASRIVAMPFLRTIEPPDVSAMDSLGRLAAFEPGAFESVMSHALMRDGMSDDLAPIVATLHGVAETNPGLIAVLLHPAKVIVERRTITLPLASDVVLAIIRTAAQALRDRWTCWSTPCVESSGSWDCRCRPTTSACSTRTPCPAR